MPKTKIAEPLSEDKYSTIKRLVLGEFNVPVKSRTKEQTKAYFQYWRSRKEFSVAENVLYYNGKKVLRESQIKSVVKREFKRSKGGGIRAVFSRLSETYVGIRRSDVRDVLYSSKSYQKCHPKFLNKPKPIPVESDNVAERWQIDLVDMRNATTTFNGRGYNYILSVLDVFSRYVILAPLTDKGSKTVAKEMQKILSEHGSPKVIQCDRGNEFRGVFESTMTKKGIKIIRSRPYHPQSQGKCERSHRSLKAMIRYSCRKKKDYNWAANMHKFANIMNTTPKEVLGYQTPFSVYFGRQHSSTSQNRIELDTIRQTAKSASRKCSKKMVQKQQRKNVNSVYNIGETVYIKYPNAKTARVPRKHHILKGKVVDRNCRLGRYKIRFMDPAGKQRIDWCSVQYITSKTVSKENERRNKSKLIRKPVNKTKYYIPLSHIDRIQSLKDENISILDDPPGNGDCQFASFSHQLTRFGIFISATNLRSISVDHLKRHSEYYKPFVHGSYEDYLVQMSMHAYGDHLTLLALAREMNLQCIVISANGKQYDCVVSNDSNCHTDMNTLTLGYFPEGAGEHYVSIDVPSSLLDDIIHTTNEKCHSGEEPSGSSPNRSDVSPPRSPRKSFRETRSYSSPEVDASGMKLPNENEGCPDSLPAGYDSSPMCSEHNEAYLDLSPVASCASPLNLRLSPESPTLVNEESQAHSPSNEVFPTEHSAENGQTPIVLQHRINNNGGTVEENLPREIQRIIILLCLESDPSSRFSLMLVNRFFYHTVRQTPNPELHIPVPYVVRLTATNCISVRRILRVAGRESELIRDIRRIIRNNRWMNAWLFLRHIANTYFEVKRIWWRRQ